MKLLFFRHVLFVSISLIAISSYSQTKSVSKDKINWLSFEEAVKQNDKIPKKIFIDIYTDLCGWCKRMDAGTFTDPALVKYMNENFYAVKLNAERKDTIRFRGNAFYYLPEYKVHSLASSLLSNKIEGYPSSVFMNGKYEILNTHSGYLSADDLNPMLHYFGGNYYETQSWSDFQKSDKKSN